MRVLLDTHALIWTLTDSAKLSSRARALLADPQSEQLVSAASAMEIFTKHRLGKLPEADEIVAHWNRIMAPPGYTPLPISLAHAVHAGSLRFVHGDPFDRLLIAQAQLEDVALLSNERLFDDFGIQRVW